MLGQPRSGSRKAIERRPSKARSGRDPEHAAHVDQRAQRGLLEVKRRELPALVIDHGVLEERERRQRGEAVVRQDLDEGQIHGGQRLGFHGFPQRLRPRHGTHVEQRAGAIHLPADRIGDPLVEPCLPFRRGGDVEVPAERRRRARQVAALEERVEHMLIGSSRPLDPVVAFENQNGMRRKLRQRLRAAGRPGKTPAAVGGIGARQRHDTGKDRAIDQVNEAAQPVDGGHLVQVREREGAGAFVDLAQVSHARRRPDLGQQPDRVLAEERREIASGNERLQPAVACAVLRHGKRLDARGAHGQHPFGEGDVGRHDRRRRNRNRKRGDGPAGVAPSGRRPPQNRRDGQHADRSAVIVHHGKGVGRRREQARGHLVQPVLHPARHQRCRATMSCRNVSCGSRRFAPG